MADERNANFIYNLSIYKQFDLEQDGPLLATGEGDYCVRKVWEIIIASLRGGDYSASRSGHIYWRAGLIPEPFWTKGEKQLFALQRDATPKPVASHFAQGRHFLGCGNV
jgi:hypothetical protein